MEFAHLDANQQMEHYMFPHISQLVDKSSTIYLIWIRNTHCSIYWFTSKYFSSMLLAQVDNARTYSNMVWFGVVIKLMVM